LDAFGTPAVKEVILVNNILRPTKWAWRYRYDSEDFDRPDNLAVGGRNEPLHSLP
jgi:hypothetical protein